MIFHKSLFSIFPHKKIKNNNCSTTRCSRGLICGWIRIYIKSLHKAWRGEDPYYIPVPFTFPQKISRNLGQKSIFNYYSKFLCCVYDFFFTFPLLPPKGISLSNKQEGSPPVGIIFLTKEIICTKDSKVRIPGFKPWYHFLLIGWPWSNYVSVPEFLIC